MNIDEELQDLQNKLFEKFGMKYDVKFGQCGIYGNWYYIPRKCYDGYYRLGLNYYGADHYITDILKNPTENDFEFFQHGDLKLA